MFYFHFSWLESVVKAFMYPMCLQVKYNEWIGKITVFVLRLTSDLLQCS